MRDIRFTKLFQKDYRRMKKSGKDVGELTPVFHLIAAGERLPDRYRDHQLVGNLSEYRECHITPDWLLVYRIAPDYVMFERTGTHSQLFKK